MEPGEPTQQNPTAEYLREALLEHVDTSPPVASPETHEKFQKDVERQMKVEEKLLRQRGNLNDTTLLERKQQIETRLARDRAEYSLVSPKSSINIQKPDTTEEPSPRRQTLVEFEVETKRKQAEVDAQLAALKNVNKTPSKGFIFGHAKQPSEELHTARTVPEFDTQTVVAQPIEAKEAEQKTSFHEVLYQTRGIANLINKVKAGEKVDRKEIARTGDHLTKLLEENKIEFPNLPIAVPWRELTDRYLWDLALDNEASSNGLGGVLSSLSRLTESEHNTNENIEHYLRELEYHLNAREYTEPTRDVVEELRKQFPSLERYFKKGARLDFRLVPLDPTQFDPAAVSEIEGLQHAYRAAAADEKEKIRRQLDYKLRVLGLMPDSSEHGVIEKLILEDETDTQIVPTISSGVERSPEEQDELAWQNLDEESEKLKKLVEKHGVTPEEQLSGTQSVLSSALKKFETTSKLYLKDVRNYRKNVRNEVPSKVYRDTLNQVSTSLDKISEALAENVDMEPVRRLMLVNYLEKEKAMVKLYRSFLEPEPLDQSVFREEWERLNQDIQNIQEQLPQPL